MGLLPLQTVARKTKTHKPKRKKTLKIHFVMKKGVREGTRGGEGGGRVSRRVSFVSLITANWVFSRATV